jgi:hypothetical protein
MFNILVSADSKAWETDQIMLMDRSRYGEHSGEEIRGINLDDAATVRRLEEADSLLFYERGTRGDNAQVVRVGRIYDIRVGTRDIRFRFVETGRLAREVLEEYSRLLHLDDWELNRTHWAVKDGGLPQVVLDHVSKIYDVFLCYNSNDKAAVIELAEALKRRGIRVWVDAWEIAPGRRWQDELETIVGNCKSAAICVAANGIGPWEDAELKSLLSRFTNMKKEGKHLPVIPTLLPGAPESITLPTFLREFHWADLRAGFTEDNLDTLEWGVTGKRPIRAG